MSVVYLHIGTEKTGSTALQDFLTINQDALRKNDVCYPYFDIEYTYIGPKRNAHWMQSYKRDSETTERMLRALFELAEKYPKIILTDETLWTNLAHRKAFWEFLNGRLAEKNIELKTIVYLRRQDLYIYSKWAQRIKASVRDGVLVSFTFQEYLKDQISNTHSLTYSETLDTIESVLGMENMIVRVFEPAEFGGKDHTLYADFLEQLDIEHLPEYQYPDGLVNISFKGSVLEARRLLNHNQDLYAYNQELRNVLRRTQKEMEEEGTLTDYSFFPVEERLAFMKTLEEGNAHIARHFLHREDGVLFHSKVEDIKETTGTYTTDDIADVLGRVILKLFKENEKLGKQLEEETKKPEKRAGRRK